MAGGLVEPQVDCDHRVELRQYLIEPMPARRGQHRISRHGDQSLDLTLARGGDLLDKTGHRDLTQDLFSAAHPGRPSAERRQTTLESGLRLRGDGPDRRPREHRPTGYIEVTGKDVDHVDEPAGQAAEFLIAQANSAVDDGLLGARELTCQVPDALGADPGDGCDAFGRPVLGSFPQCLDAVNVLTEAADGCEVLLEQCVHHRKQKGGIGARGDRQPFVGLIGGGGTDGVDDDHGVDALEDAHHIGGGEQRTLGGRRVGAHHHQKVGALDIGHREAPPVAEHQVRREVFRPLVDGAGRITDRDARHPEQHTGVAAE